MGYEAYGGGTINIKKDKFQKVIDTAIEKDQYLKEYMVRQKQDADIEQKLCSVFDYYGYEIIDFDSDGNTEYLSRDSCRLGNDDQFFAAIAPYVEQMDIEMTGEDDCKWKYVIRNGEFNEYNGVVIYPDDPEEYKNIIRYISNSR